MRLHREIYHLNFNKQNNEDRALRMPRQKSREILRRKHSTIAKEQNFYRKTQRPGRNEKFYAA